MRRAGNTTGAIQTANGDITPEGLVTLQPSPEASNQIGSPSPSDILTAFPDLPPSILQDEIPVFAPTYSPAPESVGGGDNVGGGSGGSSQIPTTATSSIGGGDSSGSGSSPVPTIFWDESGVAEGEGAGQSESGNAGPSSPTPTTKDHIGPTPSPVVTGGDAEDTRTPTPQDNAGSSAGDTLAPSTADLKPTDIGDESTSAPVKAPTTEQIFQESDLSAGIAPSALPSIVDFTSTSEYPSEEPYSSLLPSSASEDTDSSSLPSVEPTDQTNDSFDLFPSTLPSFLPIDLEMTNGPTSLSNSPSYFAADTTGRPSSRPSAGAAPLPAVEVSEKPSNPPAKGPSKKPTEQPTQQPIPQPTKVRMIVFTITSILVLLTVTLWWTFSY